MDECPDAYARVDEGIRDANSSSDKWGRCREAQLAWRYLWKSGQWEANPRRLLCCYSWTCEGLCVAEIVRRHRPPWRSWRIRRQRRPRHQRWPDRCREEVDGWRRAHACEPAAAADAAAGADDETAALQQETPT